MSKEVQKTKKKKLWMCIIIVVAAVAAAYLITSFYFTKHFLPNTTINGIECSGNSLEELKQKITEDVNGYELTIAERGGSEETVRGSEFGLKVEFDDTLDNLLHEQKSFAWPAQMKQTHSYEPGNLLDFDDAAFETVLNGLACMDQESMTVSEDAKVVFSENQEFEIQPAVFGTYMEPEVFHKTVEEAVLALKDRIDLEEEQCYVDPVYTEESEETQAACDEMNQLMQTSITYDMLDAGSLPVSKEDMSKWIVADEQMNVSLDEEAIAAFVSEFANKYNTLYKEHKLKTSWGSTVTISKGSYGWKLDQEAECAALKEEMLAQQTVTREPKYSRRASSHLENDYGNTYVEINLTAQHLYFYKDGKKIIESDFVSGNVAKGHSTPTGIYPVTYTQKDAVLRGDDYETPVSYWMPFNGGVGLHDATWRSSFGGTIYKTNGSHGCINLPYSAAKTIFGSLKKGDPVLVYNLPGTERASKKSESKKSETQKPAEDNEKQEESSEQGDGASQDTGSDTGGTTEQNDNDGEE